MWFTRSVCKFSPWCDCSQGVSWLAFTGLITTVPGKSRSPFASAAVFRPSGPRQQKTSHSCSLAGIQMVSLSRFLLLPFPGKALMSPTWTLSRPHVVLWLPELSDSSAYFTAPAPVLCLWWDWNLTFNSWCFKLSSWQRPDPRNPPPPKKTKQPLDDTRWQHNMLNELARELLALGLLGAHSLILLDLIHFNWLITQCKQQ